MLFSSVINKCESSNDELPRDLYLATASKRSKRAQIFLILVTVTAITSLIWLFREGFSQNNVDFSGTKKKQNPPWMSVKAPPGKYNFYVYRILGNDLPPRHKPGQVLHNVRFILENELNFPSTMKWWILNRIVDSEYENALIDLMVKYNQYYFRIPFDDEEYQATDFRLEDFPESDFLHSYEYMNFSKIAKLRAIDYTYYDKNLYAINNNGGRNVALLHARSQSAVPRWIFPFDGNCYLTNRAFDEITTQIDQWGDQYRYFVVPMARLLNNTQVLTETGVRPSTPHEPQVIFRYDAEEKYDEKMRYGRRSKLELLWRLGVPQTFRRGFNIPWETQNSMVLVAPKVKYKLAGYVYRLFSGKADQELNKQRSSILRAYNRLLAIQDFLDGIDERIARKSKGFDPNRLFLYDERTLNSARLNYWSGNVKIANIVDELLRSAGEISSTVASWYNVAKDLNADIDTQVDFLELKDSKVFLSDNTDQLEKTAGDKNDYATEGVSKTSDFDPDKSEINASMILSQVSTSSLFENITILTLAHHFSGNVDYSRWAANLIRTFLLSSYGIREKGGDSRLLLYDNDHLDTISDEGYSFPYLNKIPRVIPKFKSAFFQHSKDLFDTDPSSFLDSCRLLYRAKAITHKEYIEIRLLASYWLEVLINSPEGIEISLSSDHRGVFYDLQVISLAGFLDDVRLYLRVANRVRMRIAKHFYIDNDAPVTSPMTQINEIMYVRNEIKQGRMQFDNFDESVFKYSTLNLQYWMLMARIIQNVGIGPDLWQYVSREGKQLSRAVIGHLDGCSKNFEDTSSLLPLLYITRAAYLHDGNKLETVYNCEEYKKTEESSESLQKFMENLGEKAGNSEKIKLKLLCGSDPIESDDVMNFRVNSRKSGLPPLWMFGIA